jgi:hypothetical protein
VVSGRNVAVERFAVRAGERLHVGERHWVGWSADDTLVLPD